MYSFVKVPFPLTEDPTGTENYSLWHSAWGFSLGKQSWKEVLMGCHMLPTWSDSVTEITCKPRDFSM